MNPCDDFYTHVCAKWVRSKTPASFMADALNSFMSRSYELLLDPPKKVRDKYITFISVFYNSCVELWKTDLNYQQVLHHLFEVGN